MDIKEITEAWDGLDGILIDAIEAKKDDGQISTFEMVKIALGNAPALVQGFMGLDVAVLEGKDIDKDEAKYLAGRAIGTGKLIMQLFAKAA